MCAMRLFGLSERYKIVMFLRKAYKEPLVEPTFARKMRQPEPLKVSWRHKVVGMERAYFEYGTCRDEGKGC